jgi:putative flippase GtrA
MFFVANLIGTGVDTAALWMLSRFAFESYVGRHLLAPTLSFELAVINNFVLSYFWTWAGRVGRTPPDFFRRFVWYNLNAASVFFLKLILLNVIALLTGVDVVIANLLALLVTGIVNFFLQDKLIFRRDAV